MQPTLTPKRSDSITHSDKHQLDTYETADLEKLAARGLIAGPSETQENFFKRCKSLLKEPSLFCGTYHLFVDWVPVIYSNKKLLPWEGAATWIGKKIIIQLREAFTKKGRIFGNHRDEVIEHELVHAIRSQFEEPRFEELLAYRCSSARWRQYLGPLLRSKIDLLVFALSAFLMPFGLLGFAYLLGRLIHDQKQLTLAEKNLGKISQIPQFFLLCLTDREITLFAKSHLTDIMSYIKSQTSTRWNQIQLTALGSGDKLKT